jgi:bacillithiol system protein YtxJ
MSNWKNIESDANFFEILENSVNRPQLIFKHSTSCGTSAHAEMKLEEGIEQLIAQADFNYLDLLRYRSISNLIAAELHVTHQSPQIILVINKQPVYTVTHNAIDVKKILNAISNFATVQ